jgi:diaminopimelate decarboxylase
MGRPEGFCLTQRVSDFPHLKFGGVHFHIGSQLTDPLPILSAIDIAWDFIESSGLGDASRKQNRLPLLDIGGGFPVPYGEEEEIPSIEDFASPIVSRLQPMTADLDFAIEPGRYLTADIGALVLTVQYKKEVGSKCLLVVDAGINALIRPALYHAFHRVVPLLSYLDSDPQILTSIVGPICESSDVLARDRFLLTLTPGDCLAFLDCGAYGFSMASNYNSQPHPPEVLVEGNTFRLIRHRETYADLIAAECKLVLMYRSER